MNNRLLNRGWIRNGSSLFISGNMISDKNIKCRKNGDLVTAVYQDHEYTTLIRDDEIFDESYARARLRLKNLVALKIIEDELKKREEILKLHYGKE